jgi:hypothetical protein
MSVVGGKHVLLEHNLVDGVDAAGIYISQEKEYKTFEPIDVRVEKNVVKNAGSQKSGHGSLMVHESARPVPRCGSSVNLPSNQRDRGGPRASRRGRRLPDAGVRQSR